MVPDSKKAFMGKHAFKKALVAIVLMALALISFQRFFQVAQRHLTTPYDLKMESHNLVTIKAIDSGHRIYDASFFGDVPFVITIYNPLYFLVVAAFPPHPLSPFFTGRLVSMISSLLVLCLLFFPGQNRDPFQRFAPFPALILLLTLPIFVQSAIYTHPDMLALFLAGSAIVLVEKSTRAPIVVISSLLAFLAFATKQTFICALFATFLFLLFMERRKACLYAGTSLLFLGGLFFIVPAIWGQGYLFSTLSSILGHPSFLTLTVERLGELFHQPMFVLLAASSGFSVGYTAIKHKEACRDNPYLIYMEITALAPLVGLGKIGGEASYYLEFMLASLLWLVFFTRRFMKELPVKYFLVFLASLAAAFFLDFCLNGPSGYCLTKHPSNQYFERPFSDQLRKEIKALKPQNTNFLVLNTHILCPLFQRPHFNDPYNYWLMWNCGIMTPGAMIQRIQSKYFSVIIYASPKNPYHIPAMNPIPTTPATAKMFQAINENYRLAFVGVVSYFVPLEER